MRVPAPPRGEGAGDGAVRALHVRFYGEDWCSYNHAGLRGVMDEWGWWTPTYPRSKVFLDLVGANITEAATTGGGDDMVGVRALYYDLLPTVQNAANYGGIMLWDSQVPGRADVLRPDEQTYYGQYLKAWA